MITLSAVPNIAAQAPKIRYNVPMSLWFVENNHRCVGMAEIKRRIVNPLMSVSLPTAGLIV